NATSATTYATLIGDASFLQKIRPQVAGGAYTVSDLQSRLNAQPVKDTALIRITAQEGAPEAASALAADVAGAFLRTFKRDTGSRAKAQQRAIQAQITALGNEIERLSGSKQAGDKERAESLRLARAALTQQLAALVANNIAEAASVSLTAPPTA